MRVMLLLTTLILLTLSQRAESYAQFIGHGYTTCITCHYSPFGGGPINDYGRGVSATAISSRILYPDSVTDEKLSYMSGFLFRKPKQNWLRTQVNYRGFKLVRNPGGSTETSRWINMQLDGRVIVKFGENDKFVSVFNYGYAPEPVSLPENMESSKYISREHYLGYRFTPKFGVYAGLMDKVYGIKIIEHIAYSRLYPQVTQNDQVHGLTGHYLADTWELGVQGFVGNMAQEENLRMKGVTFMGEKTIFEHHRLGLSGMSSKNEFQDIVSYAVHGKFNLKEGSAILAEVGQTSKKTLNGSDDRDSRYGMFQTYIRPWRGLYFFNNIEYSKPDVELEPYVIRWGPGVQFFAMQRVELRMDFYNSRNFDPKSSSRDTWDYLLQMHLWL